MANMNIQHLTKPHLNKKESARYLLNVKHEKSPQPGDYWHEMFSPYFIVIRHDKQTDTVFYVDDKIYGDMNYFKFDFAKVKNLPRTELFKQVHYDSTCFDSAFVADVVCRPYLDVESLVLESLCFKKMSNHDN